MQKDKLILLGKIIKTHGYNGAVVIALEGDFSEKVKEMESVFVEVDGKPVPFFFAETTVSSPSTLISTFDYYTSDAQVREFIGCRVYSEIQLSELSDISGLPASYVGYQVKNTDGSVVGKVSKVVSYPMQVMFEIESSNADPVLIPFNPEWIENEDRSKKLLILRLPQGLESINN